jgi:hypothetical protein
MQSNWSDPEIESALIATLRPVAVPAGGVERMLASLPVRVPTVPCGGSGASVSESPSQERCS